MSEDNRLSHEATTMQLPQSSCLNEAATIILPQLLLKNEASSMKLPQLASIRLLLRHTQENVLASLGNMLRWFLTHPDWFLMPVSAS